MTRARRTARGGRVALSLIPFTAVFLWCARPGAGARARMVNQPHTSPTHHALFGYLLHTDTFTPASLRTLAWALHMQRTHTIQGPICSQSRSSVSLPIIDVKLFPAGWLGPYTPRPAIGTKVVLALEATKIGAVLEEVLLEGLVGRCIQHPCKRCVHAREGGGGRRRNTSADGECQRHRARSKCVRAPVRPT